MPSNRAFTLLELLVVITIIGILSSIVIVSMSGSTDSATIAKGKTYAQQVHALLGSNAVGVWNFDEGAGTTLTDISGYGNNGTLNKGANGTGLDWVSSDIGGTALQFDGVDDYVNVSNSASLNPTTAITIETWLKLASDSLSGQSIVNKWATTMSYQFRVYPANSLDAAINNGTISSTIKVSTPMIGGIWYYVVYTFSFDAEKIYKDGILLKEETPTVLNINVTTNTVRIGHDRWGTEKYFDGLIDNVRIYSEALPSTEIQKHYVRGLEKLLSNQAITQVEYDQRMEEFNQYLTSL